MTVLELPLGKCQCSVCYQPTDEAESFLMEIKFEFHGSDQIVCEPCLMNAKQDAVGTDYTIQAERRFPAIPSFPQKG